MLRWLTCLLMGVVLGTVGCASSGGPSPGPWAQYAPPPGAVLPSVPVRKPSTIGRGVSRVTDAVVDCGTRSRCIADVYKTVQAVYFVSGLIVFAYGLGI